MDLKNHYKELYEKHGESSHAVQYSDTRSQFKRFEVLCEIDNKLDSIIDLGCGLGHLYEYLNQDGRKVIYKGLDFVEEFISAAQRKYMDNLDVSFEVFDITKDTLPKGYDYVLLSGVFNNVMDDNQSFMYDALTKMYNSCEKGIAFNAMSTYVDYQDETLFYVNPCEVFDFCKKNLSSKVVLRNDYLVKEDTIPFEFAVYVYR